MKPLLFLLLSLVGSVDAETSGKAPTSPSADDLKRPVLSGSGRKRLEENIQLLEAALKDMRENLATTEKNLDTIRGELRDLDGLEAEHIGLRQKYESYLNHADQEMKKNDRAQRDLAKWEEAAKTAPTEATADKAVRERLEAARMEKSDREKWRKDAESKAAKVKELLAGIEKNLRDIRSRRAPLNNQQKQWAERRGEYEKMVRETEAKKAQWEKTAAR
jgi:chromosome segregation ATPase